MVQPKQELLPAASSSLAGSDLTGIPTALPLAAPILQRSPSSSSAEHHQQLVSSEGAHRRSPSLAATATMAASCHGGAFAGAAASSGRPALAHPLPQIGTVSNRPPVLQLETSNLWWAGDDQSKGRSTEIELSPNRSASSSPVSRSHSRAAAKASDHLSSASYQSQTALISNGSGANGLSHHTPSNLRHSRVPSMNSPPQPTSSFPDPTPVGRLVRPGLVSYHSHLQPDQTLPWQERLRLACTSPDTGRWRMPQVLTPYVPLMAWAGTSLGFVVAFTFFRQELFTGLDTMSVSLAGMGLLGKTIMGLLIFLTCFPPLPLYSTLIILSGYAFGAWDGFVISYVAALLGALIVFLLSRSLFRGAMIRMLSKSPSLARVIHAIECRPSLLFLIRLAPYPYNVMNTLLASSRTLSLKVYVGVTGVSLFKLIIHTTIGSTIHNWGDHYASPGGQLDDPAGEGGHPSRLPAELTPEQVEAAARGQMIQKAWTVIGIGLCIGLFIYLTIVARNAVNETASPSSSYAALPTDDNREMAQRGHSMSRSSGSLDGYVGSAAADRPGEGAAAQHALGEQWRTSNGRPLSVGGFEDVAGLNNVGRAP